MIALITVCIVMEVKVSYLLSSLNASISGGAEMYEMDQTKDPVHVPLVKKFNSLIYQ